MTQRITFPPSPIKLYGIIGHPLGHTMSPPLHNWGFQALGVPGEYRMFPVELSMLAAMMEQVRTLPIAGLSVTIPHKVAVMPFLDGISERAKDVGAVNTVFWDGPRLRGENTDVHGFLAPLRLLPRPPRSALVLGAGGAARAALAGLRELGVDRVTVSNRSADKAISLAKEFMVHTLPWDERARAEAELVINTTPLGMKGQRQNQSPWPESTCLSAKQIAYDMVYNPQQTPFLTEAARNGSRTIDGLSMFVHQAAEQFRLWTGQSFNLDEARKLITGLLAAG